jgi:enterochelin esterase-like enzyme
VVLIALSKEEHMTRLIIMAAILTLPGLSGCIPRSSLGEPLAMPDAAPDLDALPSTMDMADLGTPPADMPKPVEDMSLTTPDDMPTPVEDMPVIDAPNDMPPVETCPAETRYDAITQLTATVGRAEPDTNTWDVFKNGHIGTTHTFAGETRLRVKAYSSDSLGWAMMRVTVGDTLLGVAHVTSAELKDYDFALPADLQGDHEIKVSYINNLVNTSGDRNLYVGEVVLDCGDVIAPSNLASGAATSLCACAGDSPVAADYQKCATMRTDGVGAFYQLGPYDLPPEAEADDTIPKGTVTSGQLTNSAALDGTSHDYWVYTPSQYDGSKPAALMVLFDGEWYMNPTGAFRSTEVFDKLIHRGEMPVTIVVYVDPGKRGDGSSARPYEYNIPGDHTVNFVLDELLPAATGQLNISDDPAHRGLGGVSSGGSAALLAAWERPDKFGLVHTSLGSFVRHGANAQGEHADVTITRIMEAPEPLPLRISVLSGENDVVNQYGNWPETHMRITTALDCAGYAYRSTYGDGIHGTNSHPRTGFPDDMRWLFELVPR